MAEQGASQQEIGERIVRENECETLTGLSRVTRWRMEKTGAFPRRRQLSANSTGYLYSEILAWLKDRPPT
jgi:prophage regulatory protein